MSNALSKKNTGHPIWITQTEAAILRKVTPSTIAYHLQKKRFKSKVVAGRQLVCREDVVAFKAGRGRPSKNIMQIVFTGLNHDEWITQKEAANLRQLTINGIKVAIGNGRIRTLKKAGVLLVMKKDVLNYRPRIDFQPELGPQNVLPSDAKPEEWITVAEAAQMRGISQSAITKHAVCKRIRSLKVGDTRLIYREDILNFKRKSGPGRPRKT